MNISNVTLSNAALALVEQFNHFCYSSRVNFFFGYAAMLSELGFPHWVADLKAPNYLHASWNRDNESQK